MRISKNGRWGVVAVVVVALVAAGAAFAATQFHSSPAKQGALGFGSNGAPPGYDRGFRGGGGGPFGGLDAAATYLGIDQSTLFQDLRSGKTLAQIANATSGKSADGLVAAMVAAQKQQLAQAVNDGRITQSQADRMSADIEARAKAMVNGTGFGGRRGFGPDDGDRDHFGGPGDDGGNGGAPPTNTTPTTHI